MKSENLYQIKLNIYQSVLSHCFTLIQLGVGQPETLSNNQTDCSEESDIKETHFLLVHDTVPTFINHQKSLTLSLMSSTTRAHTHALSLWFGWVESRHLLGVRAIAVVFLCLPHMTHSLSHCVVIWLFSQSICHSQHPSTCKYGRWYRLGNSARL